jgi:4-amino-4-deoxy-L-arabinose transferase-like glycosyltransferase
LLIAAMTAMRLVYAGVLDLRTDEAYYWTWSKESALSFLDHPPGIAWLIRFGTAIFGDTRLGVRFGGIVAMLVTQLLLADIVRRVTHDVRAVIFAVLLPEAALYYGLLMAKVAPDTAMIPCAVRDAVVAGAAARERQSALVAGRGSVRRAGAAVEIHRDHAAAGGAAFVLVPDWRRRWLVSPWPFLAALIAVACFLPVLIWNAEHDWASFRFQFVRAVATHPLSLRTVGEFIGLQFGLVGFVLLPVVLSGVTLTAWRGYRSREPVAILLSTAVLVPFLYFSGSR